MSLPSAAQPSAPILSLASTAVNIREVTTTGRQLSKPARETLLLAGLAVLGAVVVLLVLFADRALGTPGWIDYTEERREALAGPRWSLWVTLLLAQGALWGVLLPLLLRAHARLRRPVHVRDLVATLLPLIVMSALIDVARYRTQVLSPIPGHFAKVTVVTWLGTLVALVAVAGIVRVGRAAWALQVEGRGADALEEYLDLRSQLRQFLLVAGAVVAGAVLAAGALQSAADGYRGQMGAPESVLLYGLFLSTCSPRRTHRRSARSVAQASACSRSWSEVRRLGIPTGRWGRRAGGICAPTSSSTPVSSRACASASPCSRRSLPAS